MTVEALVIEVVHHYAVAPALVFDAWLDPALAGRFLFATEAGQLVRAEVDARVGGGFNFTDRRDGQDVEHIGEYLEIDRPGRLVFSFHVKGHGEGDLSQVCIDIAPTDGGCVLTLTHQMDPRWAEYAERTRAGWAAILDGLETVLAA